MRLLLSAVALGLTALGFAAEAPAPLVQDTTPIALFNGRDFDGLHIYVEPKPGEQPPQWKIEDGILRCLGVGRGYIRTVSAYADYRLKLEWRWPATPGNSGVMLHLVGRDLIWPKSVEAQLANNRAGDFATFSDARSKEEIVSRNPTGVSTGRLTRTNATMVEKPAGEWNVYEIVVSGDTVTLSVNGTQMNRMTGVQPSGGMIGFQSEGTRIDFRNIELTPLPAAKNLNAPMPR
jgi:hypothetical protein